MQVKHIRMMSIDAPSKAPNSARIDSFAKLPGGKCVQKHAIVEDGNVSAALQDLSDAIKSTGIPLSEWRAPPMILSCHEPSAEMATDFKALA